jgi:ATP-binding cassette subfamily F protein 3
MEISKEPIKKEKVVTSKNKVDKKEVVNTTDNKEIERQIQKLDTEIQNLEKDISNIESKLNSEEVAQDQNKLITLSDNYQSLIKSLEIKTKDWEALIDQI